MRSHKVQLIGIAFPFKDTPIAPIDVELPEVRALCLVDLYSITKQNLSGMISRLGIRSLVIGC